MWVITATQGLLINKAIPLSSPILFHLMSVKNSAVFFKKKQMFCHHLLLLMSYKAHTVLLYFFHGAQKSQNFKEYTDNSFSQSYNKWVLELSIFKKVGKLPLKYHNK